MSTTTVTKAAPADRPAGAPAPTGKARRRGETGPLGRLTSHGILIVASLIALLLFALALASFFWPGADDWCFGANPLDPISRANSLYFTWSGRCSAICSSRRCGDSR